MFLNLIPKITNINWIRSIRTGLNISNRGSYQIYLGWRTFYGTPSVFGTTTVKMPSLSPTMTEGTIVKWLKNEGDPIQAGDVICEIQTDKAVVSLEFDEDGILAKVLKGDNSADVKVGTPIALVVEEDDDWKNVEIPMEEASLPEEPSTTLNSEPSTQSSSFQSTPSIVTSTHSHSGHLIGPAVRNLLIQYGLDPTKLTGSGSHGNVLKGDILEQVKHKNIQPIPEGAEIKKTKKATPAKQAKPSSFKDVEISNLRRTTAAKITESKSTVPHGYATTNCNLNGIISLRKRINEAGFKASVNDFIIKCTANALGKVRGVNIVWNGSELREINSVNLTIAVATEAGILTPTLTNVTEKDVFQISKDVESLASKAHSGNLEPHELMGGTFAVSNLGMFGVHNFIEVVIPPQCAILAVSGSHSYIGNNGDLENRINLTLSYDGRGITEETAIKFLAHLKHELETISEITSGIYSIQTRLDSLHLYEDSA